MTIYFKFEKKHLKEIKFKSVIYMSRSNPKAVLWTIVTDEVTVHL